MFETSAKTGDNVEEVFSCAAKELFLQTEKEEVDTPSDVTPSTQSAGETVKAPQRTKLKKSK